MWLPGAVLLLVAAGSPRTERARLLREEAQAHWRAGRRGEAISAYTAALEAYQEAGDKAGAAFCLYGRAIARSATGKRPEADRDFAESHSLYKGVIAAADADRSQAAALEREYANVLYGLVEGARRRGDLVEARRIALERRAIYAAHEDPGGQAVSEDTLGELALAEGRFAPAKTHFEAAHEFYKKVGNPHGIRGTRERADRAASLEKGAPTAAAAAKEQLAGFRELVPRFYSEFGRLPASLEELARGGEFLEALPELRLGEHTPSRRVHAVPGFESLQDKGRAAGDSGGWGYDPESGLIFIDCRHSDPDGRPFYLR